MDNSVVTAVGWGYKGTNGKNTIKIKSKRTSLNRKEK